MEDITCEKAKKGNDVIAREGKEGGVRGHHEEKVRDCEGTGDEDLAGGSESDSGLCSLAREESGLLAISACLIMCSNPFWRISVM